MRKGWQGDHNIRSQKNCNHWEDQRAPFHTQFFGKRLCQLQGSAWTLIDSVQRQLFLNNFLNIASPFALRDKQCFFIWILKVAR